MDQNGLKKLSIWSALTGVLALFLISHFFLTLSYEGPYRVDRVIDGDTIDLNTSVRIRLAGIDTPEKKECFFEEAKDKLSTLVLGKEIFIEKDKVSEDRYGRTLAYLYQNETSINSLLVQEGYAKVYDKYKKNIRHYTELKTEEIKAKEKNQGVWACEKS